MTRIDNRAWFCAPLFVLVLGYIGCTAGSNDSAPAGAPRTKSPAGPPTSASATAAPALPIGARSKPDDLVNSLGNPAAVLVISGEQNGYMEPCGCSEDQEGGLIRRYDLVERLRQTKLADSARRPGNAAQKPQRSAGRIRSGEDQV